MNDNSKTKKIVRGSYVAAGLAGALAIGFSGCKSDTAPAPIVSSNSAADSGDPAAANMAQPYTGGTSGGYTGGPTSSGQPTRVLSSSQSFEGQASGETYGYDQEQAAPIIRQAPSGHNGSGQGYTDAEEAGEQAIADTDQPPPPLPEYDQPPAPDPNYLWTPGYWNYAQTGYYWVPGAWCAPPFYGALWTPPYWGYGGSHYLFHRGYWGPHVGFYGGVDYGFGYIGTGYYGGYWRGRDFVYNRAVTNVNVGIIHNVYTRPVVFGGREYGPHPMDRVSYNGGRGGLNVQPRPDELAAAHEAHYPPVAAQREVRLAAASNRGQFAAVNGGRPAQAFAARPVGSRENIAAAPQGQPFNRGGAAVAGARPGFTGPGAQPGLANGGPHPGFTSPGARPGTSAGQPAFAGGNHPGLTSQRPAETQPNAHPGFEQQRPGGQPAFQHPTTPAVTNRSAAGQGGFSHATPSAQPQRAAPAVNSHPQAAPAFSPRPQAAPQSRPEVTAPRAPAPIARPSAPAPQVHSAPAPASRPAPAPHAAPGPAPHGGGGGGEHGGHH